ncbi:unnamed protein product, partial [Mesorhabditis spiculigera]
MSPTTTVLLLFAIISIVYSQSHCKINVKFRSKTDKEVQVDMLIPGSLMKMEPFTMDHKNQNKSVMVKGDDCEKKAWLIRVWKLEGDEWVVAKKAKMKLFGNGGWIRVIIEDDYTPRLLDRYGVMCFDGDCG